jgi:hypothetical protein
MADFKIGDRIRVVDIVVEDTTGVIVSEGDQHQ